MATAKKATPFDLLLETWFIFSLLLLLRRPRVVLFGVAGRKHVGSVQHLTRTSKRVSLFAVECSILPSFAARVMAVTGFVTTRKDKEEFWGR
jgi:hypothetical protein